MATDGKGDAAAIARGLTEAKKTASLATLMPDGAPYASLVSVAFAAPDAPVLLLSDLAQHSKNIARDKRVSLLLDGTAGAGGDRLDGPRLSILGTAAPDDDAKTAALFLARHPEAKGYAGFADFRFYRVAVIKAQLVAGFGKVDWLSAAALRGESSQ